MDRRSKIRGFTLLELMVTIAIAAILLTLALPSFQGTLRSNRLATTTNQFSAAIALARSEAIKSTQAAGLCPSDNGTSCAATWGSGWLVWRDIDRNGSLDGTEPVIQYFANSSQILVTAGAANRFSFDSRGVATSRNSANAVLDANPVIVLQPSRCPAGQQLVNQLTMLKTGQVTTNKVSCS